jgi:hypothetical protein
MALPCIDEEDERLPKLFGKWGLSAEARRYLLSHYDQQPPEEQLQKKEVKTRHRSQISVDISQMNLKLEMLEKVMHRWDFNFLRFVCSLAYLLAC